MSDSSDPQTAEASSTSLQRRRALFKGLFGGAAAAAVPLKAQANFSGRYCDKQGGKCRKAEASTFGSVISLAPNNPNECKGHSHGHYCDSTKWTFSCNNGGHYSSYTNGGTITKDTRFCRAFNISDRAYGTKKDMTLFQLCNDTVSSVEKTYAVAFANANKLYGSTSPQFPYDPAGVVVLYKGAQQTQGRTLFDSYLSQMS
jgi:hypothetical protein